MKLFAVCDGHSEPVLAPQPYAEQGCLLLLDSRAGVGKSEILASYQRYGTTCARTLSGDYAFILWDQQRQRLLAARSITGRCPLYLAQRPCDGLLCASDPTQVLAQGVSAEWQKEWLAFWLLQGEDHWRFSPWQAIRPLLPGHTLIYEQGHMQTQASWFPPARLRVKDLSFEEAAASFRAHFLHAIQIRLQNQQEVSFDCSGGIDSSSIVAAVAYMQERGDIDLRKVHIYHGYSARFPEEDARLYLAAMLERYPVLEPHLINYDEVGTKPLEISAVSYPSRRAIVLPALLREKERLLERQGSCAHYMGEYGDHLFAPKINTLLRQRSRLPYELWEWRHIRSPLSLLWQAWLAECSFHTQRAFPSWIDPEVVSLTRQGLEQQERWLRTWISDAFQRALLALLLKDQSLLPIPTEEEGTRVIYFPYLDQQLLEFLCQCPIPYLMAPGQSQAKALLREALSGILPELLRQRHDKGNGNRVVAAWSRQQSQVFKALTPSRPLPFIDHEGLISAIDRMAYGDCRDQRFVYHALALAFSQERRYGDGDH